MSNTQAISPTANSPWWHSEFAHNVNTLFSSNPEGDYRSGPAFERAALLVSAHRSTNLIDPLQIPQWERAFDALGDRVTALSRQGQRPFDAWHRILFVEHGLSGNGLDYHDARNSFLPDVLDRRIGIPIALAVIAMAVARRSDLPVFGVGMPGHFLLAVDENSSERSRCWIDPFNAGMVMDYDATKTRFIEMFGPDRHFDDSYLEPTHPALILTRMLANLKQIYAQNRDLSALLDIMRMRTCLPAATLREQQELIRLLHNQGYVVDALEACDLVEQLRPDDRGTIDAERDRIAASLN